MGRYDPNLDLDPLGVAPTGPVVGSASRVPGVGSASETWSARSATDPEGVAPTGPGPGPGPGLLSAFQGPSPLLAVVQTFLAIYSLDNSRKKIKL